MLKKFIAYYKPYRGMLFLDMLASLFISVIGMVYPIVTNEMLGTLIPDRRYRAIVIAGLIVLLPEGSAFLIDPLRFLVCLGKMGCVGSAHLVNIPGLILPGVLGTLLHLGTQTALFLLQLCCQISCGIFFRPGKLTVVFPPVYRIRILFLPSGNRRS